ncbi:MAG: 1-deoxy-D-xylulose-5-phosphate reductoisomerase, partial [Sphingobacteriales bacterium]
MKNITILGSTGSIGTQALEVVRDHPEIFKISVLSALKNAELLI